MDRAAIQSIGSAGHSPLCRRGSPHSTPTGTDPLPRSTPQPQWPAPEPLRFSEHRYYHCCSALAGPDLPPSRQESHILSLVPSLPQESRAMAAGREREPHCSSAKLGRLDTS